MYLFYEHHKDPAGKILLTEIKLSSSNSQWNVAFYNPKEKMLFEIAKQLLKWPPVLKRSADLQRYVWSYFEDYGAQVIQKIEDTTAPLGGVTCIEIEDLFSQAAAQTIHLGKRKKIDPAEFFYNHGVAQATPVLTKEQVIAKLAPLLLSTEDIIGRAEKAELKKLYRAAAMRLHPDRNNGDGSRMSDLNMLWSIYNT